LRNRGKQLLAFVLAIFASCLLVVAPCHACLNNEYEVRLSPRLQKAYFEIQKLRLPIARTLIEEERAIDPNNAFIQYLDNYADLHYLLISEDQKAFKVMSAAEDARLNTIGKLSDASPYKRFFQAEIRLHWAFAKMKFGHEVSGAWDVIKAYKLLDENQRRFPEFLPTKKSMGMLHVMIGAVPENYSWVTRILGLRGNIQLGVLEIESVINEVPLFRQEAQLIDLLLHAYVLQMSDAQRQTVRELPFQKPDNLLLHFFATTILMKEGNARDASGYLYRAPSGEAYIAFPFLDYLKGELLLQQGDYQKALDQYAVFLKNYRGFNFIKDSNFKMFMCLWLSGLDQKAASYILKVTTSGTTIVEGDKFAQRMAELYLANKLLPEQKPLYRARYASDGGYLTEAAQALENVSEKSFTRTENKAEYNYRKARILHKGHHREDALKFYERAILVAGELAPAIGASSALQSGLIYQEKKQKDKAIYYFKKAISYKKHEFKNSIDNKARAALTAIEI
jgi:tetratricopeptide (TPR) repeat protein